MARMSADTASTEIVVVRHGQSKGNAEGRFGGHGPTPLTEHGHQQARHTGAALADDGEPVALYSSDLPRAVQTAEAISSAVGVDVSFDSGLRERSLGVFDNLLFTEVQERYPEGWKRLVSRDLKYCPEGGEPVDAVFERVSVTVDRIVTEHPAGRVILVSHGLAIFHLFAHVCGLGSPANDLKVFALVDNCSMSTFRHRKGRWRVMSLNDRAHLPDAT